ncbi:hypothetical protein [Gordonia sp. 'Campus']|uniref:hypothetical protein n=1 Tax=Gordonia sp. 'Campus' TaxID=2915824 RepID=UPI001EE43C2C|nr:hypothetical protein [Gordonia sp. 'Campus']
MTPDQRAVHRLRGGVVGALSASTAVTAHGMASGALPAPTSLLLMTAACAVFGWTIASMSRRGPGWVSSLGMLAAGQALAHFSLGALDASSAHHDMGAHSPSQAMLLVHAVATLVTAVAIRVVEPALTSILTAVVALLHVVVDPLSDDTRAHVPAVPDADARPGLRAIAALDNRGPPILSY